MTTFAELGLAQASLQAIDKLGYSTPTPVQEHAIPEVLAGRDIIAAAKTGTGKTAAFALPSMDGLGHAKGKQGPLMLVVTPTRELAAQIAEVCGVIATQTHHRVTTVVGGVSYDPQVTALRRGCDVLIATPGRLIDLMDQKAARLADVEVLVLDEADRMLDMGFLPSVKRIVGATPKSRQTLLFSATIDRSIEKVAGSFLADPAVVEIAHKGEVADTIDQYIVHVPQTLKADLLRAVVASEGHERVIVFTRTRSRADATCRRLKRAGYKAEAIHSSRTQNQRRRALDNFAKGETDILVATDVLARGIDVDEVDYVVNYDLPTQPEDYVHRIGRTGRAGKGGRSISFVSAETEDALRDIEKLTKHSIPELAVKGFDVERAAQEAAERATRAASRKDPDIAEAKRELNKKKARKERAKKRAAAEAEDAQGATKPNKGGNKKAIANQGKKASGKAPGRKDRTAKEQKKAKAPDAAKGKTGTGSAAAKSAPKASASQDFRPGRARRAQLARQRKGGN